MLEKKDIKLKDLNELKTELANVRKELFRVHCRQVTDLVQNHTMIRGLKKNIALLNTVIREKELSAAKTAATGAKTPPSGTDSRKQKAEAPKKA